MTSPLNPAPWPAGTLATLTATASVQLAVVVELDTTITPTVTIGAETIDILEDAAHRPFATAEVLLAGRPFGPGGLDPAGWATGNPTRLTIRGDYGPTITGPDRLLYTGWVIGLHDEGAGQRISAVSLDALLDMPYPAGGYTPDPETLTDAAAAIRGLQQGGILGRPLPYVADPVRPPSLAADTLALIAATPIQQWDSIADWAAAVIDCHPNAWSAPTRDGTAILVSERLDPDTLTPDQLLDLRPGRGLTLGAPIIDHTPDDWANVVEFTAEWLDAAGSTQNVTTHVPGAAELTLAQATGQIFRTTDIRRRLRPPGDTLAGSPVPGRIAARLAARTWRATVQTKPLLWVRPGTPARVTDTLTGVIESVRFTHPGALQTLTIRPI